MSITMTIEIPALDRLCGILESQDKSELVKQIEDEIVRKMEEAVKSGAPKPTFEEVPSEPQEGPQEPPKPKPTKKSTAPAAPEPAPSPVTLDAVQRAAAQMRDEGKLKAVTDMFPEFGIKKLSDLKGDALQGFADRLREMGATL